jgi:DNA polymerase II small subunit/DNA polymerase delta subunit B
MNQITFQRKLQENIVQLEKLIEQGSDCMVVFRALKTQFKWFVTIVFKTLIHYKYESNEWRENITSVEVEDFRDQLVSRLSSLEYVLNERSLHLSVVKELEMQKRGRELNVQENGSKKQTQEEQVHKDDSLKVNLVVMESKEIESEVQDDNSRLGNDTDADCAEIRPFYDSEPNFEQEQMVEVQSTVDHIMPANEKQQFEQPNFSNEGEVDQNVVQCPDKYSESESLHDNLITETSNQTLESANILLKKTIAQCHKDFSKLEAHCISLELQMQNESINSGNNGQFLNEQRKRVDTLVKAQTT